MSWCRGETWPELGLLPAASGLYLWALNLYRGRFVGEPVRHVAERSSDGRPPPGAFKFSSSDLEIVEPGEVEPRRKPGGERLLISKPKPPLAWPCFA